MRLHAVLLISALAVSACGKPAASGATSSSQVAAAAGGPPAAAPAWVRDQWGALPDWNLVANDADGGKISFQPRSIRRDGAAGTADVLVQVLHVDPVPYKSETATTVETEWYYKERATYRFNCGARTYVVLARDYMGVGEKVIGSDHNDPKSAADWRPIDASGLAGILEGPVCKAA